MHSQNPAHNHKTGVAKAKNKFSNLEVDGQHPGPFLTPFTRLFCRSFHEARGAPILQPPVPPDGGGSRFRRQEQSSSGSPNLRKAVWPSKTCSASCASVSLAGFPPQGGGGGGGSEPWSTQRVVTEAYSSVHAVVACQNIPSSSSALRVVFVASNSARAISPSSPIFTPTMVRGIGVFFFFVQADKLSAYARK